ncbi:MAG: hypothetical protein FJ010_03035 [Chloroflexi bacterium]|nr:hypothetical protein [Chloroflexota bacterium]
MLFFLGLLSVLQITLLPGILILKAFDIRRGFIQDLIFSFALSLIANHLIVFAIAAIGIHISYTFYGIFLIELVLLIRWYAAPLAQSVGRITSGKKSQIADYLCSLNIFQIKDDQRDFARTVVEILGIVFAILAASSIWWAFKVWYTNFGTVFTQWDAVVSWNHWATEWFAGSIPTKTSRYAQLIPTNYAVSYAFLRGMQIQFFAKSIMPLFNLFILLSLFDLGMEYKNMGYFIGVLATRMIIKKFLGEYISSGYVDVALAFFAFVPIYTLLKAKNSVNPKNQLDYVQLGAIFAAGAALTKPNGLVVFVAFPVLAYFLIVKKLDQLGRKEKYLIIAKRFLISLLIIMPWYLWNEYWILVGGNDSNVSYLMGERHQGRTLVERFMRATGLLEEYVVLYLFVILMLPFLDSAVIWIVLTILIPYSLIWAFAFSTFTRNLAIAFPLLGLASGMSAHKLLEFGERFIAWVKVEHLKLYIFAIMILLAMIVAGIFITDTSLITHQVEQQKDILLSSVNRRIYAYFDEIGRYESIMTNYPIQYLPGLENMRIDIDNFANHDLYHQVIENHPEARLMLVFVDRADEQVLKDIAEELEAGNYQMIFEDGEYMFIEIKR